MEFPAAVDDDVAFVSNYHGSVRAYSMHDGAKIWRRDTAGKMAASPAIAGEEVVAHGMDGRVYVLNRHNGHVVWTYDTGAPIESSPLVLDGVDYFGTWNGTVYALDLRTRQARWTTTPGTRSPRARPSRTGRSTSATTAGGCSRWPRATAPCAGRARSAAGSTALPRSRAGACS